MRNFSLLSFVWPLARIQSLAEFNVLLSKETIALSEISKFDDVERENLSPARLHFSRTAFLTLGTKESKLL